MKKYVRIFLGLWCLIGLWFDFRAENNTKSPQSHFGTQYFQLKDPFLKPFVYIPFKKKKTTELEKFPIKSIKISAILYGLREVYAMLLDPTGKTHIVKEKTPIGISGGYIEKIEKDAILVREYVLAENKKKKSVFVKLFIEQELMDSEDEEAQEETKDIAYPKADPSMTKAILAELMRDPLEEIVNSSDDLGVGSTVEKALKKKQEIKNEVNKKDNANASL